ncbi:MAG: glycosyltransferase family A protein [Planctomycetota bacterium]
MVQKSRQPIDDATTLSVVIPAHNCERWLPTTLKSVHDQKRPADEIVVVDDGSQDASAEIARSFGVDRLVSTGGIGAAGARNVGVEAASGTWLAFLDADDIWYPERLARTASTVAGSDDDAVLFHFDHVSPDGDAITKRSLPRAEFLEGDEPTVRLGLSSLDYLRWYARSHIFPGMTSCVVRRAAWLELGGMDPTQTRRHDLEFFLRFLASGRTWSYDPIATSAYRGGQPNNLSANLPDRERFHQQAVEKNVGAFRLPEEQALMEQAAIHVARAYLGVAVTHGTADQRRDAVSKLKTRATGLERWLLPLVATWTPGLLRRVLLVKRAR